LTVAAKLRLLIVDDHAVVREGLCALFGRCAEFDVVGEAADGIQALELFRQLRPDVAIIDLRMPHMSGIELIKVIIARDPHAKLLVLSSLDGDGDIRKAMSSGACGFLLKGASGEDILKAVRQVHAGEQCISREVRALLMRRNSPELSPRELEVLGLIALGLRNQEIATKLGLTINTVKVHVQSVLIKLNANDRTEAAVTAIKRGIVQMV